MRFPGGPAKVFWYLNPENTHLGRHHDMNFLAGSDPTGVCENLIVFKEPVWTNSRRVSIVPERANSEGIVTWAFITPIASERAPLALSIPLGTG
jgi:hypothetical protein